MVFRVIWELIKGEMEYVADLEVIDNLFVNGLRVAENGPIIDRPRLEIFLDEAFHNYRSLLEVHQRLLESLQQRQIEQHPQIYSIGDLMLDAALNWHDAYMEYVTHYPIARAKVQEEAMKNPRFEAFLEDCRKDPSVEKQDIYHFINRPVPRLLRYNLLLPEILKALKESDVSDDHPDIEAIPQVIDLIKDLGRATETGVAINESKVELWTYQHSLDGSKFGPRTVKDLDLLNPTRELIHRGKVYRQPEGRMSSWTELTVLLFDNYLVLVKPEKPRNSKRDDDRPVRYVINRPPIPLELLSLGNFGDGPRQQRRFPIGSSSHDTDSPGTGDSESNKYWPFSISFIGQDKLGGQYTLWTDTAASRTEWQQKLLHAKVLRAEVNDANKVFDMTPLSLDTFFMAQSYAPVKADGDGHLTGRVTCSTPFSEPLLEREDEADQSSYCRWEETGGCRMCRGCMDRSKERAQVPAQSAACQGSDQRGGLGGIWHLPGVAGQGQYCLSSRYTSQANAYPLAESVGLSPRSSGPISIIASSESCSTASQSGQGRFVFHCRPFRW